MDIRTQTIPCKGIKGNFFLSKVLDLEKGILIDPLHLIYEGICKFLLKKWFNSKYHDRAYYIGKI